MTAPPSLVRLQAIPVAGRDGMLMNLSGAHGPFFTRNLVVLTDSAGRNLPVPRRIERVLPAGPPAAILLYTLAPDALIGWPRANRPEELEFLLPGVGDRPAIGRITGRGNSANLESVLRLRPDLILDSGSLRDTYVELADRVQSQTGIPCALLDGRFAAIPDTYKVLGELLDRPARARELSQYASDTMRTVASRIERRDVFDRCGGAT